MWTRKKADPSGCWRAAVTATSNLADAMGNLGFSRSATSMRVYSGGSLAGSTLLAVGVLLSCSSASTQAPAKAQLRVLRPRPELRESRIAAEHLLPIDNLSPSGLVSDGRIFWIADPGRQGIWQVTPPGTSKGPLSVEHAHLPFRPGPLALDTKNQTLWVVDGTREPPRDPDAVWHGDAGDRRIVAIPLSLLTSTSPSQDRLAEIPVPREARNRPITGLAWDGRKLWLCTAGGLCACVLQVDQLEGGKVLASFFPRCEPLSLAIDQANNQIWLIAERGPGHSYLLLRRALMGPTKPGAPLHPSDRTNLFVRVPAHLRSEAPNFEPRGLSVRDGEIWLLKHAATESRLLRLESS